jgi:polar amino acid transport system substrate-binding protein
MASPESLVRREHMRHGMRQIGYRGKFAASLVIGLALMLGVAACGSSGSDSAATSASGCKPKHKFSTVAGKGQLTVSLAEYPPYAMTTADGKLTGLDGDIINTIAQMECLKSKPVKLDVAGIPSGIQTGRADVAGGSWNLSKDRQKVVDMTDPLYLNRFALLSKEGMTTIKQLDGSKSIGDLQGNWWNAAGQKRWGNNYKLYPTMTALMSDLVAGRIEVAIGDPGTFAYYIKQNNITGFKSTLLDPDPSWTPSAPTIQSGLMLSKKNAGMRNAFNDDIAELKSNGKLKAILEKWGFPARVMNTGPPIYN